MGLYYTETRNPFHVAPDGKAAARRRQQLLDVLTGPVPTDPNERYFHHDLCAMEVGQLLREEAAARLQLLLSDRPSDWWRERLQRVQEEIRRAS